MYKHALSSLATKSKYQYVDLFNIQNSESLGAFSKDSSSTQPLNNMCVCPGNRREADNILICCLAMGHPS